MRQYGLDLRLRRPGWRRWRPRRVRIRDWCLLLKLFYPQFIFEECEAFDFREFGFEFGVRRLPFAAGPGPRFLTPEAEVSAGFCEEAGIRQTWSDGPHPPAKEATFFRVGLDRIGVAAGVRGGGVVFLKEGTIEQPLQWKAICGLLSEEDSDALAAELISRGAGEIGRLTGF